MARTLEVCNKDLDEDGVLRNCMDTTAAYFSDSLMTTLENCFFGSCDEITNCVYRVLDNYDIEDLYDFFFESLGIYSENPDPAYECQSDNDCGSVEFCNLATNTCTPKDHNPSEDCDLNLECQDGWYCDMNTRRCMQNDCSLALGVFIEAIDEACHGRDLECCFCKCWNDERQIYSDYTYNSSGECVCGKGDVGWYENNCYGDYREEAQDCLADREACKTEESKIVLSNEFGLCTHTPL